MVFEETGLTRCDVIKIDVQGYECHVLRGMTRVLARFKPAIIFEYERWAWAKANTDLSHALKLMDSAGYRLWRHGGNTMAPLQDAGTLPDHSDLVAFWKDDHRLRRHGMVAGNEK